MKQIRSAQHNETAAATLQASCARPFLRILHLHVAMGGEVQACRGAGR